MLFRIKCGNVEGVSSDQRRIVYLLSSTEAVLGARRSCVFTDGNAAAAFTGFYEDPELLSEVVGDHGSRPQRLVFLGSWSSSSKATCSRPTSTRS
jgi:hypothetical protein